MQCNVQESLLRNVANFSSALQREREEGVVIRV
jgi:hypothetical protein